MLLQSILLVSAQPYLFRIAILSIIPVLITGPLALPDDTALVENVSGAVARVSVDSTFSGYRPEVLVDGRWIEKGQEVPADWGNPNRLGNGGNTWASADVFQQHWIQLDWREPVEFNQVMIVWSLAEWRPRAFRIEYCVNQRWEPVNCAVAAWEPTDRRCVIATPLLKVESLRIVQPAGCGGSRELMAAQEVAVDRSDSVRSSRGVRDVFDAELRQLVPLPLLSNVARLHDRYPGASSPVTYKEDGAATACTAITDGDTNTAITLPDTTSAIGVEWPIRHMVHESTLIFADAVAAPDAFVLETHDGARWKSVPNSVTQATLPGERRIVWGFQPLATRALRVRSISGRIGPAIAEFEVQRYLPPDKSTWPDRLTQRNGLQQELRAKGNEPSFEQLAACALSMTPVRALVGVTDDLQETGVAWDGTILGRETIRFLLGEPRYRLADGRETLHRTLLDGWLPAIQIRARLPDFEIRQTVFSVPVGDSRPPVAVMVRLAVRNLTDSPRRFPVQAELRGDRPGEIKQNGPLLYRGEDVVLVSLFPNAAAPGDGDHMLRVDATIPPHGELAFDFLHPQSAGSSASELAAYRAMSFETALARCRAAWERLLSSAVRLEVPEPRVDRMYRAILAQLFVNADGDKMPYGAGPSVYDGDLFGIEESYAMLALAMWGFGNDAQRYLDGTYLTPQFLHKVGTYRTYVDRHQQYRNGLQPHYAVSAYRLSRDRDWIGKHLPLLQECAEWTIRERQATMQLKEGSKPLHWGLLPQWSYGGDIAEVQCYALYANLCCWRGLVDTAWLVEELGDSTTARRYAAEAASYRADILRAMEGNYRPQDDPPFLPLRLYAERPDEQMDYYQLFAGCMLDVEFFRPGDRYERWITDFLEADNRTLCLLPRFRRDVGPGGLDALYGKGYVLAQLRDDKVREFLLGFYAYLAWNLDHETFISRETNVLYTSDLHVRSAYPVPDMSDPVPCSSAVALHFLRHMLATEQSDRPEAPPDQLLLFPAVPRSWLADGKRLRVEGLPTAFGPVFVSLQSAVAAGRITVDVVPPKRAPPAIIKLRLRHPDLRPLQSVTVNGLPWSDFDPRQEWILLRQPREALHIVAQY